MMITVHLTVNLYVNYWIGLVWSGKKRAQVAEKSSKITPTQRASKYFSPSRSAAQIEEQANEKYPQGIEQLG